METKKIHEKEIRYVKETKDFLAVNIHYYSKDPQNNYTLGLSCSCGRNKNYWNIKYYMNNNSPHFREEELLFTSKQKLKKWIKESF